MDPFWLKLIAKSGQLKGGRGRGGGGAIESYGYINQSESATVHEIQCK